MNWFSLAAGSERDAWVERLGWVLLHSLWQFALVAFLASLATSLIGSRHAARRYGTLLVALTGFVVAPPITAWWLAQSVAQVESESAQEPPEASSGERLDRRTDRPTGSDRALPGDGEANLPEAAESIDRTMASAEDKLPPIDSANVRQPLADRLVDETSESRWEMPVGITARVRGYLPWLVSFWLAGVLLNAARPALGWYELRRLRRVGVVAASVDLGQTALRIARRLGVRAHFDVFISTVAPAPVVLGYFRPAILVPVALLSGLPVAQFEALLAHELAHIRRHDFLVNLLQTLLETLFFYHPAVWWLSRRLRIEREHCCDDLVVERWGHRVEYGRALVALVELRGSRSTLALGSADGVLLARIKRIAGVNLESSAQRWRSASLALTAISLSALLLLGVAANSPAAPRVELAAATVTAGEATEAPATSASNDVAPKTEQSAAREAVSTPPRDAWPMWGGNARRNGVSAARIPRTWDLAAGTNVAWQATVGTATYSSPVVADGRVFIGTNNGAGLDPRIPADQDRSCLVCFDAESGKLLWHYASAKLPAGRVHDWPGIGLCSSPCVVGERVWVLTNRCEVICFDTRGFADGENDGAVTDEPGRTATDADIVWKFDLYETLGVRPEHQAASSVVVVDDLVLLNTSHCQSAEVAGQDIKAAPQFLALQATTGRLAWRDGSGTPTQRTVGSDCSCPGTAPAVGTMGGVRQAVFAGRDGWLYSFDFDELRRGVSKELWRFDCNPKQSRCLAGGRGDRNTVIAPPVIDGDRVLVTTGRNPEEGDGPGDLWCVDATRRGDLSGELVFNPAHREGREPIAHKMACACDPKAGDFTRPNPNSGVIWHYRGADQNEDRKLEFQETLHRSLGAPLVIGELVFLADLAGLLHCVDAATGKRQWTLDLLSSVWSSCVAASGHILIADENGEVTLVPAQRTTPRPDAVLNLAVGDAVYGTPAPVGDTLYLATRSQLLALRMKRGADQPPAERTANDEEATTESERRVAPAEAQPAPTRGVLTGRILYDGERPVARELHPRLAALQPAGQVSTGNEGRKSGVEGYYVEFLRSDVRPRTTDSSLQVGPQQGLANVFIWAFSKGMPGPSPERKLPEEVTLRLEQGVLASRHVALTTSQRLRIENRNPVSFQVRSGGFNNTDFNVLLRPWGNGDDPQSKAQWSPTRGESLPLRVTSDLAVWADGWILVRDNPYFAVTDGEGRFSIADLPPGTWEFRAWHERCGFLKVWPRGIFPRKIEPGENSLGDIRVPPAQLRQRPRITATPSDAVDASDLPEWLRALQNAGVTAQLDENDEVSSLYAGRALTDELLTKFATLPRLRELKLETSERLTPEGLGALRKMTALRSVSLYQLRYQGAGLGDAALRNLAELPDLRELAIGECGTTDEGLRSLTRLTRLESLSIRHEGRLTDSALASIGALTQLKSLALPSLVATIEDGRMRFSAEGLLRLAKLEQLESLDLTGHAVTAESLSFPRLRTLSLGGANVDDQVAMAVERLSDITRLHLVDVAVSDAGLAAVARLPKLVELELSGNRFTDQGVEAFARHPALVEASLRGARLGDGAARHLSEIRSLRRVTLGRTARTDSSIGSTFTAAGFAELRKLVQLETLTLDRITLPGCDQLRTLTQPREIMFSYCDVSPDELARLCAALPDTLVQHATGGAVVPRDP